MRGGGGGEEEKNRDKIERKVRSKNKRRSERKERKRCRRDREQGTDARSVASLNWELVKRCATSWCQGTSLMACVVEMPYSGQKDVEATSFDRKAS